MKETFIEKTFASEGLRIIGQANAAITRYAEQGYDLTLRQLYYQFISQDWFPDSWIDEAYNLKHGLDRNTKNTEKNYKSLGGIISDARVAGLIDWDAIADRGRSMVQNAHWDNPRDFLGAVVPQFAIRKWDSQPGYVEVMVEKQALEGILEPVCGELDVPFTANKGYSSSSAMYACGRRFRNKLRDGKECFIIYLGDHDPSGLDMTRDVVERINMFAKARLMFSTEVEVQRVALNINQVKKLRPPENPAKVTDPRAKGYIREFGESSWELDAIEPNALAKLVKDAVYSIRDADAWETAVNREDAMRAELESMAAKSKFK